MLQRQSQKQIKVWCAAASSGQEPYTIAMTCCEAGLHLSGWNCRVLATDVSNEMLDRCKTGQYSQFEVNRGLPARLLVKYFERNALNWCVRPDVKKLVEFRKLNLLDSWPCIPQMDIIFIRNVLIYFDRAKKEDILKRAHRLLAPDGYLFLGGGETLINLNCPFVRESIGGTVCYRPTQ
jgi:chemotaxis protein methyltransferase CheR